MATRHIRIIDRKKLQDNWAFAMEHKKRLDDRERQRSRAPGMHLLQQCDKYRRYTSL